MEIRERAERAAKAVYAILQVSPTDEQTKGVIDTLEQTIINAMLEQAERCTNTIMECCSPDLDLAHKMTEEIRRTNTALMTNLSSMR